MPGTVVVRVIVPRPVVTCPRRRTRARTLGVSVRAFGVAMAHDEGNREAMARLCPGQGPARYICLNRWT